MKVLMFVIKKKNKMSISYDTDFFWRIYLGISDGDILLVDFEDEKEICNEFRTLLVVSLCLHVV